jgi:hypothetical protein
MHRSVIGRGSQENSPTEELYSERNAQLGGLGVLGGKHELLGATESGSKKIARLGIAASCLSEPG